MNKRREKPFYGWLIVAASMLTIAASIGLVANSFSIFIVPVCGELGFSRSQMSATQTIFAAGMMLVSFFWGAIYKRIRLKRVMNVSAVLTCACYLLYAFASKLWMFYAISAVLAITMAFLGWMPFTVIISNWFNEKRGLAIGITFMGSGVGGMIFNALGGALIAGVGWRWTIAVFAAVLTITMLPIVVFFIKLRPEEKGLAPLGALRETDTNRCRVEGVSLSEALHGRKFYFIALCTLALGFCMNSLNSTMNPHLQSEGYSGMFAANVVSGYMAALAAGKIGLGALSDKIGAKNASTAALAAMLCAVTAMLFAGYAPMVAVIILCSGFGNSFGSVAYPLITREVYGERDYPAITGMINSVGSLGSAIGPTLCGVIFDSTGSYMPAYIIMTALVAIAGTSLLITLYKGGANAGK